MASEKVFILFLGERDLQKHSRRISFATPHKRFVSDPVGGKKVIFFNYSSCQRGIGEKKVWSHIDPQKEFYFENC
ncbi:hypothetical protein NPIL_308151 [Nephila pilipes]|uniref:Uncharacterized protein n=1 Tax=Nephila pilipes TaxID=299642 RepID=A0A8X6T9S3_NEPPI|nr:hypothetical protein NPIL_308151 [Nephila pilipes]